MNNHIKIGLQLGFIALLLGGCGHIGPRDSGPAHSMDLSGVPDLIPRYEPRSKYGNPPSYTVRGRTYQVLGSAEGYRMRGTASWYGRKFHGRKTSSGEVYNMYAMTAAHKTLPLPTYVRVTNLRNGRSTIVKVNDRGPFHDNRLIDLSYAAASKLGIVETGTGQVEIVALNPGRPEPSTTVAQAQAAPLPRVAPPAQVQAPETKPVQPPVPPAAGQNLYLQLGAFISRDNAERLRSKLAAGGNSQVSVQPVTGAESTVYRVRLGPLASEEEADRLAAQISAQGLAKPHIVID